MVTRSGRPGVTDVESQRTSFPATEHTARSGVSDAVAEMPVTPAGTASLRTTDRARDGPALAMVTIQLTVRPGTAASPEVKTFVTLRSAAGLISVVLDAELLLASGSVVTAVTLAGFTSGPVKAGSTVAVTVMVPCAPAASAPNTQVRMPFDSEQAPRGPVPVIPDRPAGMVSVTTTACASDGPSLAATRVQLTCSPAKAAVGPVLVSDTSADAPTGVLLLAWLSVGSGSGVVACTLAVLTRVGATVDAATVAETATWIGGVVGVVSPTGGNWQVTVVVPSVAGSRVQAAPPTTVAEMPVSPAGRVSVTTAPCAMDGPVLDTVSVQLAGRPAVKVGASADFPRDRFARVVVPVVTPPVLLSGLGSGVPEETMAALLTEVAAKPASSTPSTVTVTEPAAARVPNAQCSAPPASTQEPAPVLDATKVTPACGASSSTTAVALDGPALATRICHRTCPPATGDPDRTDLTAERSALAVTGPEAVAVAVRGALSRLSDFTDAVLVMIEPVVAPGGTATTTVTVRVALSSTTGQLHVTVAAAWQVPSSDAVAETSEVPAGTGSVRTTLRASDGPRLTAVSRKLTVDPATIGPLVMALLKVMSERVATGWLIEDELLATNGSGVGLPSAGAEATVAVLLRMVPPRPEASATVICTTGD